MSVDSLPCVNFPPYIKEHLKGDVYVYWYHPNFSQSGYPPGQKKSEACTLICVLLAQLTCKTGHIIHDIEDNLTLNCMIAKAIIKGNKIHRNLLENQVISHSYLSIEEALFFGEDLNILKEWEFEVIEENITINLYKNIKRYLEKWNSNPISSNLFMLLIVCNKTVLFIFQEQQVILFDPHGHNIPHPKLPVQRGLVLAQTAVSQLKHLCDCYVNAILDDCCRAEANQYELAFLYNCKKLKNSRRSCACSCNSSYSGRCKP